MGFKKVLKLKRKEKIYKWLFLISDRYKVFVSRVTGLCLFFLTITLFLFILSFLYYIGFDYSPETGEGLRSSFKISFLALFLTKYIPAILTFRKSATIPFLFNLIIFLLTFCIFLANFHLVNPDRFVWRSFTGNTFIVIGAFLIILSEFTGLLKYISIIKLSPALIFSFSFFLLIVIGTGLLMLPKAHVEELSWLDSLFTSVSAVCVTGLTVVDTATAFTTMGKIIILSLIQIGGLGIMTFTGFFSYIFTTSSSFRDKLLLKEIFSTESLNNLFKLLTKIIMLAFLTEIIGALIIYGNLDWRVQNKVLFSVFHSVSAFCNAGFSTLTDGMLSYDIRFNSVIQLSVALLVILGGIGFPVLIRVYSFVDHRIRVLIRRVRRIPLPVRPEKRHIPVQIVLVTTAILLIAGTGFYILFESDNSLRDVEGSRRVLTAFFGSVSARTAGFNIVDISLWSYPTVFFMILLMWIGASPGSTGGGIKTTTIALAFRSVWNSFRGGEHLLIGNREIGSTTITRVLSIIILSLAIITTGFFCLLLSEPDKNPIHLLFESFSAFGTVGLSLAGTSTFSNTGKIIVMLLMFIGRIGPLTLFTGFMLSYHKKYSRYPELDIIIN